jgi:tRNA(Ile2) C34 agmatinyltransferase TiaS
MTKIVAAMNTQTNQCHRCGGLMVEERIFEIGSIDWRCVSCGDRVDQVILANRQRREAQQEGEEVFSGSGRARLN